MLVTVSVKIAFKIIDIFFSCIAKKKKNTYENYGSSGIAADM